MTKIGEGGHPSQDHGLPQVPVAIPAAPKLVSPESSRRLEASRSWASNVVFVQLVVAVRWPSGGSGEGFDWGSQTAWVSLQW